MSRPFRFAVQGQHLDDHDRLVAEARNVEDLGHDELFSYDHVGAVDPFIPLTVAAAATTRLRVGPLVLNNEFHQTALLARTAATVDRLSGGAHHQIAVDDVGIRPVQHHVPFLIGGHGKRVVSIAARHADIFQFTGLTHGEGGKPAPGGFAIEAIRERSRWLEGVRRTHRRQGRTAAWRRWDQPCRGPRCRRVRAGGRRPRWMLNGR